MKRIINCLSVLFLFAFTFVYTEKASDIIKEHDNIMIKIKSNKENYYIDKIEPVIKNDTIIPGKNGKSVNVEKSYQKMKLKGVYSDENLVFNEILVTNSIDNCKDKYIINGNESKKALSIIYEIKDNNNLNKIMKLLDKYELKITFFIDGVWLEKNRNKFYEIINANHEVGSVGYNYTYDASSYVWVDNVIKIATNDDANYCLKKDDKSLEICKNRNNYTLSPIVINMNPFITTKDKLKKGAILYYKDTNIFVEEFELILKYIRSKKYEILTIGKLLEE